MSVNQFFKNIYHDLYYDVYKAVGGSLEDEAVNWPLYLSKLASTGIKIMVLLAILGVVYRLSLLLINSARFIAKDSKYSQSLRLIARLMWLFSSLLAVMSQLNFEPETVKATAKAGIWSVIFYMAWYNLGYLMQKMLKNYGLNASIEQLLHNLLSMLIIVLWIASVMSQFGFDIVSVVAGLGIAGIAVGFAAQATLANFIAGITILIEQSFQVGDWVNINEKEGKVVQIALRTTQILTRDNITVIFPNSTVASAEVINLTAKNLIRFDIEVRIALEADIESARAIILDILANTKEVLERPAPTATVDKIGDFGVFFIVRFWVNPPHVSRMPFIKENLREQIKVALDDASIATPYPHMQLLMPSAMPSGEVAPSIKTSP
ncbi:mechanosensitive ion channel family protein [Moraxella osloensis]|uniref:Small-conductance mechanosensitive channel n=1 Tax=Faucicola osloensis TaxID=34062 RepID=A0AAW6TAN6_FAUOS|nr:mechanosensitive ion channel family protein [Moraxella osloensis]MDI4509008.1 mechanosensitive ion channel family protein [Moraxella osloensis]